MNPFCERPANARILVVDAGSADRETLEAAFASPGREVIFTTDASATGRVAAQVAPDCIVLDTGGRPFDSTCAKELRAICPPTPLLLLAVEGNGGDLGAALRSGAFDLLSPPYTPERARPAIERALAAGWLARERIELERRLIQQAAPVELPGTSAAAERLRSAIRWVASSDAPALIVGESGSGKEMVARAIHQASMRRTGPFLAMSCAALPPAVMAGELFGTEPAAAAAKRSGSRGCLARAAGGTFLLDEISELPLPLQPRLHRALLEHAFLPPGGGRSEPLEARVLLTTNCDLAAGARSGRFSEDFLRYLEGVVVEVPPLRERREDIPLLAGRLLAECPVAARRGDLRLSPAAIARLIEHDWPGNVRELRNVLERAVLLSPAGELRGEHLILDGEVSGSSAAASVRAGDTLRERERGWILQVLRETGGNRSAAARRLGVSVRTIRNKLAVYRQEELRLHGAPPRRLRPAA